MQAHDACRPIHVADASTRISPAMTDLVFPTTPDNPKADVLIKDLIREYDSRYGQLFSKDGARAELYRYPPEAFAPERGGYFFLIERAGKPSRAALSCATTRAPPS
ncbi:hypothetical protein QWZ10_06120 [Paracoccus cavernae]|uniref:Uncharacterized protein n=1 Tax=Paracoccus cavernae TaxID=1571207 RepID=A0ABT8D5E4_9RHOB|nr:hypothetical protein [Paracoccus cavernae]